MALLLAAFVAGCGCVGGCEPSPGSGAGGGNGETGSGLGAGSAVAVPSVAAYGTLVGTFNGVAAYSNGSDTYVSNQYNITDDGTNTGMKWQCVEYVKRYYYLNYGKTWYIPGQNANDYYGNATALGLTAFPNTGTTAPQVGDILAFAGGSGELGHVAIIRELGADYVKVIQQNVTQNSRDADFSYSLTVSDGTYTVSAAMLGQSYTTQGWLRAL